MIGHDSRVNSAACSPDGQRIVTASYDGTVQIYTTDMDKLLEIPRAELPVNWQLRKKRGMGYWIGDNDRQPYLADIM